MSLPPLTGFESKCVGLLNAAPSSHSRHCIRSALHHLERAGVLIELDPAMAVFRAITAEEEAASGLMRCLRELGYPRSDELNPHDHVHKHAVFPFMEILGLFFGQTIGKHFQNFHLHIKGDDGETRLTIALSIVVFGEQKLAYPIPPLNFGVSVLGKTESINYSSQIAEFTKAKGMPSVKAFLKKEANLRNTILYAGPDGYPVVQDLRASFVEERRRRVIAMLNSYLLIYPYKEHQPYVTQALSAFADLLKGLKKGAPKHET